MIEKIVLSGRGLPPGHFAGGTVDGQDSMMTTGEDQGKLPYLGRNLA